MLSGLTRLKKSMQSMNFEGRDDNSLQKNNTDRDLPRPIQRAIQMVAVGEHPEILPTDATLRVLLCELLRCLPFKTPRCAVIVKKSFLAARLGKGEASIHRYLRKLEDMGAIRRGEQAITRREGAQIGEIYFTDAALHAMGFFSIDQREANNDQPPHSPTYSSPPMIDAKRASLVIDASDINSYSSSKSQLAEDALNIKEVPSRDRENFDRSGRIPDELLWLTTLPQSPLNASQIFRLMGKCRKAYGCNLSVIVLPLRHYIECKAKNGFAYVLSLMDKGIPWFNKISTQPQVNAAAIEVESENELAFQDKAKAIEGIPFIGQSGYVLTIVGGLVRRFNPKNIAENVGDVPLTNGFFDAIECGRLVKYQTA